MDPVRNPYAPGAGNPPPELAGRSDLISEAQTILQRIALGRPAQSLILIGLRGVGKTVLLNRIREMAEQDERFLSIQAEAHEGKTLAELLVPGLRQTLYRLSLIEKAKEKARRGLRVLKSFVNGMKLKISELDIELSMSPEFGVADTGNIENDLPALVAAIGEAAKSDGRPVLILLDELQYLDTDEFSALIMAMHLVSQKSLPVLLIGAGLPQILGLAGNSKSYAERLFRYPRIGALDETDAMTAISNPAKGEGISIEDSAIQEILSVTKRYPYFLQQWGYESWNLAQGETITQADVRAATPRAIKALDESFFRVRFERCTPGEKRYMRALAEFGDGQHRSGDVADKLGVKVNSVAPTRSNLIKKGMIYSPSHGDTAFTVPLFHEYMKRAMPGID
ncbi:MAG TPA: ATP-binding protein [Micropepsaceae bacterium]|nr:ATP-binding protein [Micropepsaceae bacterium]